MLKYKYQYGDLLLTLGKKGCLFLRDEFVESEAKVSKPVDTVGAGDAVFCLTALLSYLKYSGQEIADFANIIGAIAVEIVGNKDSIKPEDVVLYLN
jgi:sugar/nucleoside kinase (ribokinase family)